MNIQRFNHGIVLTSVKMASLGSVGMMALLSGAPLLAQAAAPAPVAQPAPDRVDEIVVTARREAENVQRVPVSIQVVTSDKLRKLAITSVEEVSKLAPGLTLINAGSSTAVTLRGVTWQPGSGTPATPIYFNEVPFDPGNTIVSLFDVGQIEVLRGPQGTSRGAPSISGAVTISTRKPNLNEFGGYVQGLYGSGKHGDVQGAVNIPLIKGMLAVRLAGNVERSEGNRVRSVNSNIDPKYKDTSLRATVLFKPADNFTVLGMYQRRKSFDRQFTQVAGNGSPGSPAVPLGRGIVAPAIPAGYNGPPISVDDRLAVGDLPNRRPQHIDLITVNANWQLLGHNLMYNFGKQINRSPRVFNNTDPTNFVPGFEQFSEPFFPSVPEFHTHEIRLSSIPNGTRPFDYDIGWFEKYNNGISGINFNNYTPGAFGAPYSAGGQPGVVTSPNNAYLARTTYNLGIRQRFDNFYGNVRVHLGEKTEFGAGVAFLKDHITLDTSSLTNDPLLATPAFAFGVPFIFPNCAAVPGANATTSVYPGYCDTVRVTPDFTERRDNKYKKTIYNFSLSHQFTDDLLVYATTGSSFRTGLASLGNDGIPAALAVPKPESAKSYELGVKATVNRNLRFSAAVFQLDYKDQLTTLEGLKYYNSTVGVPGVKNANVSLYGNLDARVRGVEGEVTTRPFRYATVGANVSYSKIKAKGGTFPCNGATPTVAVPYQTCVVPSGQVLNTQAPFQATINGAYEAPFTDNIGGYLRFNVNYKGRNPNFGNFRDATGAFRSTQSYALVDLFAGLTGGKGTWDLGVYGKNVFNKNVELSRVSKVNDVFAIYFAPAGYDPIRTTLPREIGVTMRYAFGSR